MLLLPSAGPVVRVGTLDSIVSGTTDPLTVALRYTYALKDEYDTTYPADSVPQDAGVVLLPPPAYATTLPWSIDTGLIPGLDYGKSLKISVYAYDNMANPPSLPTVLELHMVVPQSISLSSPVPSGVTVVRRSYSLTVQNPGSSATLNNQHFVGYNYFVSLTPGGGSEGYARLNRDYVSTVSLQNKEPISHTSSTSSLDGVDVTTTVDGYYLQDIYSFEMTQEILSAMVTAGKLPNIKYTENTTFYFVACTVLYDNQTLEVSESQYSAEVSSRFVVFVPQFRELPPRSRMDILTTMSTRLAVLNPRVSMLAGTVFRDTMDPIAEEFADYYIQQDFISRTQSIDSLMAFDDANGDGVSDPVSTSLLKQQLQVAMRITNDSLLQSLVDSYFDKYAANEGLTRLPPSYATGNVLFYINDIPVNGVYISDGAIVTSTGDSANGVQPVNFTVEGSRQIAYRDKSRYYNPTTKRYEISAGITCSSMGLQGNVPAGNIATVTSGADSKFRVVNTVSTTGGNNSESNLSLGNRVKIARAGLDSGTKAGYMLAALGVGGVSYVKVQEAGDSLMRRDIDTTSGEHIGGKVDVYVQGNRVKQTQDTFSFVYGGPAGTLSGDRFYVEDANTFRLRTDAPAVTPATPIFEVIRVLNVTRGQSYDVSGATVGLGDGDTLELAANTTNLTIGLATLDVLEVDYRYRGSNSFTMSVQPVQSIVSVTGDLDGELPPENYLFQKLEDPLINGNSTVASDGVSLEYFNGLPTSSTQDITAEAHVLTATSNAILIKKGVDTDTLVLSSDVNGINVFKRDLDYKVLRGGDTGYTEIELVQNGKIRNGNTIYASYTAGQNFTVVYMVNDVLERVQSAVDSIKHAGADVVVKQAVSNDIDLAVTVIRNKGYTESDVSNSIASVITGVVSNLPVGGGLNLDDAVSIIKGVKGVKTVQMPLKRLMKKNGSFITNDLVGATDFMVYYQNSGRGVTSYITINPVLSYGTEDKGGPTNMFRAIYEDGNSLVLADSPLQVSEAQGKGYINADGRIIVSTRDGAPPQMKSYSVAYYTFVTPDNDFARDIEVDSMEHLTVGSDSISVDASMEEIINRRGI